MCIFLISFYTFFFHRALLCMKNFCLASPSNLLWQGWWNIHSHSYPLCWTITLHCIPFLTLQAVMFLMLYIFLSSSSCCYCREMNLLLLWFFLASTSKWMYVRLEGVSEKIMSNLILSTYNILLTSTFYAYF